VPCYRCGTRQVDPEPGKPSPWHRGIVCEHQVLICPDCYPTAVADLTRCARCDSVRLVRQLDQVECVDCHLTRTVLTNDVDAEPGSQASHGADSGLAAEVARALERILGTP
jgi:hypothetical protein